MPNSVSTAPASSSRMRLIAGFGLVVGMSAAVGVATHPVQFGSPVAQAESGSLTDASAPVLDLSAQARDDWMLTGAGVPVLDLSAQGRDDWRLPRLATDRHTIDPNEDVARP